MRNRVFLASAAVAVLTVACSGPRAVDEQLKKDLEAAAIGTIELAPSGAGTKVVSALESKQPVQPRVTPTRRTIERVPEPTPQPQTRQVTQTSTEPAATAPRQLPPSSVSTPRNPRSVGEVIRNAPFPINPATSTKRP